MASCNGDGEVVLLDLDDGRRLDRYAVGGGEALPGYSSGSNHFYVRGDPGTRLATLAPSSHGLRLVKEVAVPEVGHCLTKGCTPPAGTPKLEDTGWPRR